jgi:hypothetical protein
MAQIKTLKGNKILSHINEMALRSNDPTYKEDVLGAIRQHLNKSKRVSGILMNTRQPSIEELVVIASHLEVKVDELLIIE